MSETYPKQIKAREAVDLPVADNLLQIPGRPEQYEAAMMIKGDPLSVYLLRPVPGGKDWLRIQRRRVDADAILLQLYRVRQ